MQTLKMEIMEARLLFGLYNSIMFSSFTSLNSLPSIQIGISSKQSVPVESHQREVVENIIAKDFNVVHYTFVFPSHHYIVY